MNLRFFLIILITLISVPAFAQELVIQENEEGFCYIDGIIDTDLGGYTGDGYADTDRGIGKSISWSVFAEQPGEYFIKWKYSNGGGSGDRPGRLLLNSEVAYDTVHFPLTGSGRTGWENWTDTDSLLLNLRSGNNQLRLEAYSEDGLANYDYITFLGSGLSRGNCIPSFTLQVTKNTEAGGSVSVDPVQQYYDEGSSITLSAKANPGYFFQSWSGDLTAVDSLVVFSIKKNTHIEALFLPQGTKMDHDIAGYATIQDDAGTPYVLIGGALGDTVDATSFEELSTYLSSSLPVIVTLSQQLSGNQNIKVKSDKTLLGLSEQAHLQGIGLEISQARNVIIKNIKISHVTPQDAIEINDSKNIWIDHCELYSDKDHGQDYYDGLLDIKNASSFITVSWTTFRDHYKTSLISSGDQAVEDSVTRVTYHHNYFNNCESRLPSIRFGKAHIFNNYYKNCNTAINSRTGACVRAERNYFNDVGTAVMMAFSPEPGSVQLIDNHFGAAYYATTPECELNVPYRYDHVLDETNDIPMLIAGDVTSLDDVVRSPGEYKLYNYPNPFNPRTTLVYYLPQTQDVLVDVYNLAGQRIAVMERGLKQAGYHKIVWNIHEKMAGGFYYIRLRTRDINTAIKVLYLP